MKVCVEVLEQVFRFQDEKSLRVGATEFSKKEDFVARNGWCVFLRHYSIEMMPFDLCDAFHDQETLQVQLKG